MQAKRKNSSGAGAGCSVSGVKRAETQPGEKRLTEPHSAPERAGSLPNVRGDKRRCLRVWCSHAALRWERYNSLSERDGAAPWSFPKKGNKGKVPARGRARAHAREAGTAYTTPRQTTTARATIREDTPRNDSPRQSAAAYKKKSGARQPRRVSPRLSSVQLFPERAGSSLQTRSAIS